MGFDLRMFLKPGFGNPQEVRAAVRFGERARAARGLHDDFVHGGAIETARCPRRETVPS